MLKPPLFSTENWTFFNPQTLVGTNPSSGIFLFNRGAASVCAGIRAKFCSCGHYKGKKKDFHPRDASGCLCLHWDPEFGSKLQE